MKQLLSTIAFVQKKSGHSLLKYTDEDPRLFADRQGFLVALGG